MTLRRLTIELLLVAVVAGLIAATVTRVAIAPRIAHAIEHMRPAGRVPSPTASPPATIDGDDPEDEPESNGAPVVTATPTVGRQRPARPTNRPVVAPSTASNDALPPRMSRGSAGALQIDFRDDPSPSDVFAGANATLDATPGHEGFRIRSLDRAGYLRSLGIRRGDVIVAINGMPTRNANEALDAYIAQRGARTATVRTLRGSEVREVVVQVVR